MKSKILEALKAKFEGVSDTILDRIAAKLAKTVTNIEDVDTAVAGVTFQQVLESYGDARATDAQKTAVANYERKYGLKDGTKVNGGAPQPEPKQEPKQDDTMPEWARVLVESNKQLTERIAAIDTERTANDRKGKLDTLLKDLPEELRKPYRHINISTMSEEEFGQLIDELPNEVAAQQKHVAGKQAVFGRPRTAGQPATTTANGKPEATAEEVDAVVKRLNL